jgi:DNA-binding NarL/FixJ family response regulator
MSISVSPISVAAVSPVDSISSSTQSASKTPPPPPPPPADTVELSLDANIKVLQSQGDSVTEIAYTLGVPVQTVSIDLGTALIEASVASAPTIPAAVSGV